LGTSLSKLWTGYGGARRRRASTQSSCQKRTGRHFCTIEIDYQNHSGRNMLRKGTQHRHSRKRWSKSQSRDLPFEHLGLRTG
ncbi:hypothetical protein CH063_04227, partial [Colletotrichum higginsianum]